MAYENGFQGLSNDDLQRGGSRRSGQEAAVVDAAHELPPLHGPPRTILEARTDAFITPLPIHIPLFAAGLGRGGLPAPSGAGRTLSTMGNSSPNDIISLFRHRPLQQRNFPLLCCPELFRPWKGPRNEPNGNRPTVEGPDVPWVRPAYPLPIRLA